MSPFHALCQIIAISSFASVVPWQVKTEKTEKKETIQVKTTYNGHTRISTKHTECNHHTHTHTHTHTHCMLAKKASCIISCVKNIQYKSIVFKLYTALQWLFSYIAHIAKLHGLM